MPISMALRKVRRDRRRQEWLQANGPCRGCGSSQDLEIDHVDPSQKSFTINFDFGRARVEEELKKCQVLCHECHAVKTKAESRGPRAAHGSSARHNRHGCRCDLCKAWKLRTNREYKARKRARAA